MFVSVLMAQVPIGRSVSRNLDEICQILSQAQPDDLVVMPEGSLSGYSDDISFLESVDPAEVSDGLDQLSEEVSRLGVHLWLGTCLMEHGTWYNCAVGLEPSGERYVYRKANLATHERGVFEPGDRLPVFDLPVRDGSVRVGCQLCRDLRFPEQWAHLARQGAQVILHLNNAVGVPSARRTWSSQLISRAVDNLRFVVSANKAAPDQNCPSMVIAPNGEVRAEYVSAEVKTARLELDLGQVSDWYLSQAKPALLA